MSTIEFKVLEGTDVRAVEPFGVPWPEGTTMLCAAEDGELVGRMAHLYLPHIEGTWVAETKRGTSLAFRMMKQMEQLIAATGVSHAFAYAYDEQPEVSEYLSRVGYVKLPLTIWMKELDKEND